jgi:hypothetical protein
MVGSVQDRRSVICDEQRPPPESGQLKKWIATSNGSSQPYSKRFRKAPSNDINRTTDRDILGGFDGEPAKLVKRETNDLTVPANAEIVVEGRVITTEGWIHDEGPYGEPRPDYSTGAFLT